MQKINYNFHKQGKAGEHFVMFDAYWSGYTATMVDNLVQYDVLIFDQNKPFKIQVKTSSKTRTDGYSYKYGLKTHKMGKKTIKGGYKPDKVYIFAFVQPEIKKVAYIPYDQVRTNWEVTITHKEFNDGNLTLKSALFFIHNNL